MIRPGVLGVGGKKATVVGVSRLQLQPLGHNSIIAHVMLTLWPAYSSGREAEGFREGWFPDNIRVIGLS